MLALGRALIQLFLTVQVHRPRLARYRHDDRIYELAGSDQDRTTELGTRCGKVEFRRPVGRRPENRRAAADLPVDRELGLVSGFSLDVVQGIVRLCCLMAFATARVTYREFHGWTPSPRAALRMVDGLGAKARPFLESAAVPPGDGDILIIQVDGKGAPMINGAELERRSKPHTVAEGPKRHRRRRRRKANKKERRKKGQKSKNAKVAFVGVIYTFQPTPDGLEGPINKRIYATFESHEALFIWLHREAKKRGYGEKRTIFMGDGSEHIWRLQKKYFPDAETCLDWYHLLEYVWGAGQCSYPEGSPELRAWVARQAKRLRRGHQKAVLKELQEQLAAVPKTGPGTKGKRKRLQDTIRYFTSNLARMRYEELRREDLDIGTGVVEGAVRNLVGMRLDGPGMRWGRQRSERILHLRCILLNDQWDAFKQHLAELGHFSLPSQPEPTIAHEAKPKAA